MDWEVQMLGFGSLACLIFVLSAFFTWKKKRILGLLLGVLELILAVISSSAWAWALKISGKKDWFLLGLLGYTPIALVCYSMLAVGIVCLIANFCGIMKGLDAAMEEK